MRRRLVPNWKQIVKKAWSMRLMALSIVFTVAESLLPLFVDAFPRGLFALLSGGAIAGGMVMRVVAQKEFEK